MQNDDSMGGLDASSRLTSSSSSSAASLEDQRAMQIAVELSKLQLTTKKSSNPTGVVASSKHNNNNNNGTVVSLGPSQGQKDMTLSSMYTARLTSPVCGSRGFSCLDGGGGGGGGNSASGVNNHMTSLQNSCNSASSLTSPSCILTTPASLICPLTSSSSSTSALCCSTQANSMSLGGKSSNMTQCVHVPSSEHVAEIVGRQGCKVKSLRAKTNTYIKTPVRGEEPVFVVTGRREDVFSAKKEILSAADHFSAIRASRRQSSVPTSGDGTSSASSSEASSPVLSAPGQISINVRVPYRVVGLVVGPKGATIKRIQQQTYTYIVTPSRDKEPVFEVTGQPNNVEKAKRDIES